MGLARCELLAAGLKYEFGSLEESLAIRAIERRGRTAFMQILTLVNAILEGAKLVASVSSGNNYNPGEALEDSINTLKGMLIPRLAEDRDAKAEQVKEQLMKEMSKGPIQVKVMDDSARKNRAKRRRR